MSRCFEFFFALEIVPSSNEFGRERDGVEAASVLLAASSTVQAQINGFRSRVLRLMPTARKDLYATEWRSLERCSTEVRAAVLLVGCAALSQA